MASSIFSCKLETENRRILEEIKREGVPFGKTVYVLIKTFGSLPESVRLEMLEYTKAKLREQRDLMDRVGEFEKKVISENMKKYLEMVTYFSGGEKVDLDRFKAEPIMQTIPIKNGFLICPKDCVIVNPKEAKTMEYACVVECRNSESYHIPHYLVFCDRKYGRDYDAEYVDMMLKKVVEKDPAFKKVLDMQVEPLPDTEHPGQYLNAEEFLKSPKIGTFHVIERGDPAYPADYKPPYGMEIIRDKALK